jgi:glycosyltransferase involved in cell wall biosynthesis
MKPLVSILIPAFNAQEWLAETVKSALGQTWEQKEIIIVDDGSSDQTLAVAKQFAAKDVVVVTQDNQGAAAARNKAFSLSQGNYIQWLDADDLLASDKIAKQMQKVDLAGNRRLLLSSAWGSFMYRPEKARFTPTLLWCDLSPAEWLSRKMGHNLHMQTATWLASRELTEAAGPWDTRLLGDDDGEYFCRVLLKSDGVRFVPEAKVYYRIAGLGSLSYIGGSNRKIEAQFRSMQSHIGNLRSLDDSDHVRAACVRYLQNWLILFYPERPENVKEIFQIAASLGGELVPPSLSWKYGWIRAIFGWKLAKRAQVIFPAIRFSFAKRLDRLLLGMQNRKLTKLFEL